jgi:hypothetical protein
MTTAAILPMQPARQVYQIAESEMQGFEDNINIPIAR